MHNNLRMYWGKRIIAMTPSPEAAWATACYLNDRLSLDGRDPSTYGNIAAMFAGAPAERERKLHETPIVGRGRGRCGRRRCLRRVRHRRAATEGFAGGLSGSSSLLSSSSACWKSLGSRKLR